MEDPTATAPRGVVPHLNTLGEAARKLRRSKAWIHVRIAAGDIEVVRLSQRSVFITDDEILRYLVAHGLKPNGSAA